MTRRGANTLSILFLLLASILLAIHPTLWLVNTWIDPAYYSHGWLAGIITAGLFIWSWTSPVRTRSVRPHWRLALGLIATAAITRLISEALGINILAACTLALDIYALAKLTLVEHRVRRLNPAWLAVVFLFALPLEHVAQRLLGYSLQQVSALLSCSLLQLFENDVVCSGVRIQINNLDVLVDLPCSGAKGLLNTLLIFAGLSAIKLRSTGQYALGFCIALVSAVIANAIRIVFLAIGIAYPHYFGGANVMASPWHDIIGVSSQMMALLPLIAWHYYTAERYYAQLTHRFYSHSLRRLPHPALSGGICAVALVAIAWPSTPVDVSRHVQSLTPPTQINGHARHEYSLSTREQSYFTQFGGSASKAQYGELSLVTVTTTSPLRHLHTPEACIRGAGLRVDYVGRTFKFPESAIYQVTDAQQRQWRVSVSYVASDGAFFTNISEVVWHWLQQPNSEWHMIQRITPWHWQPTQRINYDLALFAALDFSSPPSYLPLGSQLYTADITF